jgi:uncharacterized protein (TIGR03437 family)
MSSVVGTSAIAFVPFFLVPAFADILGQLPLRFEPAAGSGLFAARGPGYTAEMVADGAIISLPRARVRMRFVGASTAARPAGESILPGVTNYLSGADPRRWRTGVPGFARVRYREIYPKIDLVFYGTQRQIEYDLVLAAGADTRSIEMQFDGASSMRIDPDGDLVLSTAGGPLRQKRPVVYQTIAGVNHPRRGQYVLAKGSRVRFEVPQYDPAYPLVIDPVLSYASFLGGSGLDAAYGVAIDPQGNIYVAGTTQSADFPTTPSALAGTYQPGDLPGDIFVLKMNSSGSSLFYATYLGGKRQDIANSIAVDSAGSAYLAGFTLSSDFPLTPGVFQTASANSGAADVKGDAFLLKLNQQGSALVYSTFLGGNDQDVATAVAVDALGNAFVAGRTASKNFPTTSSSFQSASCPGLWKGFVTKVNPTATVKLYSTYLCGSKEDQIWGIALDPSGSAVVTGQTDSTNFPVTLGAVKTTGGGTRDSAFVSKLSPDGASLAFSTYLGGSGMDIGRGVAIDTSSNVYVTGSTRSRDFPVSPGALRAPADDIVLAEDAFVVKLNPSGTNVLYATLLGGKGSDIGYAIATTAQGNAVVAGSTTSADWGSPGTCQPGYAGAADAFVAKLDLAGAASVYSQPLGGSQTDRAYAVALAPNGDAFFAGQTASPNLPTTEGAFRSVYAHGYQGGSDAFVARMSDASSPTAPCVSSGGIVNAASFLPGAIAPGELITLFGKGIGPADLASLALDSSGRVSTQLAGGRVWFDDVPAPLFYLYDTQVSAFAPYSIKNKQSVKVQVEFGGKRTSAVTVPVALSNPGILYNFAIGNGQALLWNEDGTFNSPANPAARGSLVFIWGTGEGETDPPGTDGLINSAVFPKPRQIVSVKVGGRDADLQYWGAAPQAVAGVLQVNFRIPASAQPGSAVPLVLKVGDASSQSGLTIAIK